MCCVDQLKSPPEADVEMYLQKVILKCLLFAKADLLQIAFVVNGLLSHSFHSD
jgi:hypothetical protein